MEYEITQVARLLSVSGYPSTQLFQILSMDTRKPSVCLAIKYCWNTFGKYKHMVAMRNR